MPSAGKQASFQSVLRTEGKSSKARGKIAEAGGVGNRRMGTTSVLAFTMIGSLYRRYSETMALGLAMSGFGRYSGLTQ